MIKAFLALLLVAGFAFGDDDDHHRRGYEEHHIPKDLSFLELSSEQHRKVKAILYEYKHALKRFRHEKKEHARAMEALFVKETFDTAAYEKESLELDARAVVIQSDFLAKLHAVLNPDQRQRFLHYFDEWDVE